MPRKSAVRHQPRRLRKGRRRRRRPELAELVIGPPMPGRVAIPNSHRAAVTALFEHPAAKDFELAKYLRYSLLVGDVWRIGIENAQTILDGTYPWDNYGFSTDDEGNLEGPDCEVMDLDWNFLDPRGRRTLELRETAESWHEDAAFGDSPQRRSRELEICITVVSDRTEGLIEKLQQVETGWNLSKKARRGNLRELQLTHEVYSGRAILSEPERGVLICRIVPTDRNDPERLVALVVGLVHRWFQLHAHSITLHYVQPQQQATRRGPKGRSTSTVNPRNRKPRP